MSTTINFWAVLVAGVVSLIIGAIWYGPLFGKQFLKASGMDQMSQEQKDKMKKAMYTSYFWQLISSLVMFYVLAWLIGITNKLTLVGGLMAAFWVWLGFIVPVKFSDALWGGKKEIFWLSVGSMFVTLLVAGMIIGAW